MAGNRHITKVVFIIEDDPDTIEMLTAFLEKKNYRVVSADNGTVGLTMIKFLKPDVIVVDLMLPGIDGKELVRRIRDNVYMKDKMVAIMSGMFTEKHEGEKVRGIPADAVFSKPVNLKKLDARIRAFYKVKKA